MEYSQEHSKRMDEWAGGSTVPGVQPGTQQKDGRVGRWEYSTLKVKYLEYSHEHIKRMDELEGRSTVP